MLRIAVAPQLPSVNHLSINRLTDIIGFDRYYSVQAEPESLVQITIAYYNLNRKYLGFFFDSRLSFSSHMTFYFSKAFSTIKALCMLGNSIKGLDCEAWAKIYKVAAFPVLTYGAPLYWRFSGKGVKALLTKMIRVQNYAARW